MAIPADRWLILWGAGLAALAAPLGILAGYDPRLAIVAAFGAGFVLLAMADLTAGVAAFGFISFLEVSVLGGPAAQAGKLIGVLLAVSWFAVMTTRERHQRDFISAHPFVSTALVLFLGWATLSTTWAESSSEAIGAAGRFALSVLLFVIVYSAVASKRDLILVVGGFIAGAGVAAIIGLFSPTADPALGERLSGGELDPNELAASLLAGAALAAGLAGSRAAPAALRLVAVPAAFFCVAAVLLTASRGSLIALVVMLVAALILGGRWRPQIALVGMAVVATSLVYFTAFAPEEAKDRIDQTTRGETRIQEGRTTIWQVGWRQFEANPINGVGAGNFQRTSRRYLLEPGSLRRSDEIVNRPAATHNTYLQIAAELGAVGFLLFATIIVFSVGSTLIAARSFGANGDRGMQLIALSLGIALIGTLAADTFISEQFRKQLWLLLGLGPAVLSVARARAIPPRAGRLPPA